MKAIKFQVTCRNCGSQSHMMTTGAFATPSVVRCPRCSTVDVAIGPPEEVEVRLDDRGAPVFLKVGEVSVPMGVERAHVRATVIKKDGRRIDLGVVASNDPDHPVEYRNPEEE
jgi:hypothetical protein